MYYILMNRDDEVAELNFNQTSYDIVISQIIDLNLLPLSVQYAGIDKRSDVMKKWLFTRIIPYGRDRLQYFMNNIKKADLFTLSLHSYSLSLSDQYWIKKRSDSVKWKDINFFQNKFSYDIGNVMFGIKKKKGDIDYISPDLTTNGWLRKTWRKNDSGIYLFKQGSAPFYQEPFNEAFSSIILKKISSIDVVDYEVVRINGTFCSKCKNFLSENIEFVPAFVIYQAKEKPFYSTPFDHLKSQCDEYKIPGARKFIDSMLALDYLISNSDRHMGNFGFLLNKDTKKFIGPAPLFDNGTSMWNQDQTERIFITEEVSKPFCDYHEEQIQLIKHPEDINTDGLFELAELIPEIYNNSGMTTERIGLIEKRFEKRIEEFTQIIDKQRSHRIMEHKNLDYNYDPER